MGTSHATPRQLRHTSASRWHEWRWQGLRIILPFSLKFGRAIYIRLSLHGRVRATGQRRLMQSKASFGLLVTASCGMKTDTETTVDDWKPETQVFFYVVLPVTLNILYIFISAIYLHCFCSFRFTVRFKVWSYHLVVQSKLLQDFCLSRWEKKLFKKNWIVTLFNYKHK